MKSLCIFLLAAVALAQSKVKVDMYSESY